MIISLIAAVSENNVIGSESDLPWKLPKDMKYFMDTTMGHHVLMGRKTFESFPIRYRPLPGRTNVVITNNKNYDNQGIQVFHNVKEGIQYAADNNEEELFVIGGGAIYRETIDLAHRLYITRVKGEFKGDTFFPDFDPEKWRLFREEHHEADEKNPHDFTFLVYIRK